MIIQSRIVKHPFPAIATFCVFIFISCGREADNYSRESDSGIKSTVKKDTVITHKIVKNDTLEIYVKKNQPVIGENNKNITGKNQLPPVKKDPKKNSENEEDPEPLVDPYENPEVIKMKKALEEYNRAALLSPTSESYKGSSGDIPYYPGDEVDVYIKEKWYPGTISDVVDDNLYKVRYSGLEKKLVEIAGPENLRLVKGIK